MFLRRMLSDPVRVSQRLIESEGTSYWSLINLDTQWVSDSAIWSLNQNELLIEWSLHRVMSQRFSEKSVNQNELVIDRLIDWVTSQRFSEAFSESVWTIDDRLID
jgi:hypothetical protein